MQCTAVTWSKRPGRAPSSSHGGGPPVVALAAVDLLGLLFQVDVQFGPPRQALVAESDEVRQPGGSQRVRREAKGDRGVVAPALRRIVFRFHPGDVGCQTVRRGREEAALRPRHGLPPEPRALVVGAQHHQADACRLRRLHEHVVQLVRAALVRALRARRGLGRVVQVVELAHAGDTRLKHLSEGLRAVAEHLGPVDPLHQAVHLRPPGPEVVAA